MGNSNGSVLRSNKNGSHGVSRQRFGGEFYQVITKGKYDIRRRNEQAPLFAESPVRNKNRNSNPENFFRRVASGERDNYGQNIWSGIETTLEGRNRTRSRIISLTFRCEFPFMFVCFTHYYVSLIASIIWRSLERCRRICYSTYTVYNNV